MIDYFNAVNNRKKSQYCSYEEDFFTDYYEQYVYIIDDYYELCDHSDTMGCDLLEIGKDFYISDIWAQFDD